MFKNVSFFLVSLLLSTSVFSQKNPIQYSGALHFPVGDFWSTHLIGLNAGIGSWIKPPDSTKRLLFTYKAAVSYYFGKNKETNGFDYKYPNYLVLDASAGLLFKASKKINVELSAGPGIGFYNKSTRLVLIAELSGNYQLNDLFIGPLIKLIKENGANSLWIGGLNTKFRF